MRRLLNLTLVGLGAVPLAGCFTTQTGAPVVVAGVNLQDLAQTIRDGVLQGCDFEANAVQIADFVDGQTDLINLQSPTRTQIQNVIDLVCAGAKGLKSKRMASRPGVPQSFAISRKGQTAVISGRFVAPGTGRLMVQRPAF